MLHITNGDSLTQRLKNLNPGGDIIVWREMLCEGPTVSEVGTEAFFNIRKKFLSENYGVSPEDYEAEFVSQIHKLSAINGYDSVILWFEFDLFCHINMLAAISYLIQNKKTQPVYLVCSGRVPGEKELVGLSELNDRQLKSHYQAKIKLTEQDLEMAHFIWQLYNGDDPGKLKPEIRKTSNFKYLSSCIRAHIERYPNAYTGLNSLETNVLKLIDQHRITSEHQLCGYVLSYQGYYGYGDTQIFKIIKELQPFFEFKNEQLALNEAGRDALEGRHNYYDQLKTELMLGGTNKYDFLYDPSSHQLLKL